MLDCRRHTPLLILPAPAAAIILIFLMLMLMLSLLPLPPCHADDAHICRRLILR